MESKQVLDSWARDYDEVSGILEDLESETGPAELHGTVAGLMSGGQLSTPSEWLQSFLQELAQDKAMFEGDQSIELPTLTEQDSLTLKRFYELVALDLNSEEMNFTLMLPSDDHSPLSERISALSSWIQGYLVGIGSSGYYKTLNTHEAENKELNEAVRDLVSIAQVDSEVDDSEENERYYIELVEYVKVLALTLKEICQHSIAQASVVETDENSPESSLH